MPIVTAVELVTICVMAQWELSIAHHLQVIWRVYCWISSWIRVAWWRIVGGRLHGNMSGCPLISEPEATHIRNMRMMRCVSHSGEK
jgi:hypothetical protein